MTTTQLNQGPYSTRLSNSPLLPQVDGNQLDKPEAQNWITAHPQNLREAVSELTQRVEHISYPIFFKEFKDGIAYFNQLLTKETVEDYLVMVEPQKSNLWMAELALPHLKSLPTQVTTLGKKGSHYQEYLLEQRMNETPYFPNTVVFFDDGVYSGKQMSNNVRGVFEAISSFNAELKIKQQDEIPIPQVVVISPYQTDFGHQTVKTVNEQLSEHLYFSPHQKIYTLAEVLSPSSSLALETTLWHEDPRDVKGLFSTPYLRGTHSRGNIWFDHKVPNWMSFVYALEAGIVTGEDGHPLNGTLSRNASNEPIFYPSSKDNEYTPIPQTLPPYKNAGSSR